MKQFSIVLLCLFLLFMGIAEQTESIEIRSVEAYLGDLGFLDFPNDEVDNWDLYIAVCNFQRANGLTVNGSLDDATITAIYSDSSVGMQDYILQNYLNDNRIDFVLTASDSGKKVKQLQQYLFDLGYYDGELNGKYDNDLTVSVARFQLINNLPVTGVSDRSTLSRLSSASAIPAFGFEDRYVSDYGDCGIQVKRLQQLLSELGYFSGECSGEFGTRTREAVIEFQQRNELPQTGTWDITQTLYISFGMAVDKDTSRNSLSEVEISEGDEGYLVREIENSLFRLGYLAQYADDVFDNDTAVAITIFQEANGLEMTSVADTATREALNRDDCVTFQTFFEIASNRTLEYGDSGYAVCLLRKKFISMGYPIETSYTYDDELRECVEIFQIGAGLDVSGNVDQATREMLSLGSDNTYSDTYPIYRFMVFRREINNTIGKPYEAGKTGPESFGAGGLMYYIYGLMDIAIAPTVALQYEAALSSSDFNYSTENISDYSMIFFKREDSLLSGLFFDGDLIYSGPQDGKVIRVSFEAILQQIEFVGSISYFEGESYDLG